jgi:hypothetical protein
MSIEDFTRRLSTCLAFSGLFLLVAAVACWATGDGQGVVNSVHNVGATILAAFGVVLVAVGVAFGPPVGSPSESATQSQDV